MNDMLLAQLQLPSSSRALQDYLLASLPGALPCPLGGNTGLPAGAVECLDQNLVIAVTPITGRLFDAPLVRFTIETGRDIALVRHGFNPETIDPVRVDVVLRSTGGPILVPDLSLFRPLGGGLYLVPQTGEELVVTITPQGFDVSLVAPWTEADERIDGLTRAAAEVVRACRCERAGGG